MGARRARLRAGTTAWAMMMPALAAVVGISTATTPRNITATVDATSAGAGATDIGTATSAGAGATKAPPATRTRADARIPVGPAAQHVEQLGGGAQVGPHQPEVVGALRVRLAVRRREEPLGQRLRCVESKAQGPFGLC